VNGFEALLVSLEHVCPYRIPHALAHALDVRGGTLDRNAIGRPREEKWIGFDPKQLDPAFLPQNSPLR
jgi:hypothetical protein